MVDFKFYVYSKWNDLRYYLCENFNYYYRCYIKIKINILYYNYIYPIKTRNNYIRI